MSCTGYVITYAGCPVLGCSKLQTGITLSTTEAGYIALKHATREVIPFTSLMKEVSFTIDVHLPNPEVFVKFPKITKVALTSHNIIFFTKNKTYCY